MIAAVLYNKDDPDDWYNANKLFEAEESFFNSLYRNQTLFK